MNNLTTENNVGKEVTVQTSASDAATVMTIIANAAADPNMDVAKLEKLMDLQERILNRNAKSAFASDFVKMKPNLPMVARSKDNIQTRSKYAPLEEINEAIDPILEQHGFGIATKVVAQSESSVTVRAELWHKDGHVEENTVTMPLDKTGIQGTVNKTAPHATASSITYAKRVAICALLNISTGNDTDGNGALDATPLPHEKAVEIDLLIASTKSDKAKFLSYMGVDDVRKILDRDYQKAINLLKAKERKNAAA